MTKTKIKDVSKRTLSLFLTILMFIGMFPITDIFAYGWKLNIIWNKHSK